MSEISRDYILDIMSHWSDPEQKFLCGKRDVFMYDFIVIPLVHTVDAAFVLTVLDKVCIQSGLS